MLFIKALEYEEHYYDGAVNEFANWKLEGLRLGSFSIITGQNSVGKTRVCNILKNTVGSIIGPPAPPTIGRRLLTLSIDPNYDYELFMDVVQEEGTLRSMVVRDELRKTTESGSEALFDRNTIYDTALGNPTKYSPPDDRITLHARRDKVSYPYIEEVISALKMFHYLDVEDPPGGIAVATMTNKHLPRETRPSLTPTLYENLVGSEKKQTILDQINDFGFPIEGLEIKPMLFGKQQIPMLFLKERGVKAPFALFTASTGMRKVIFLIVCLNLAEAGSCLLIDNVGDGLDYRRSLEIVRILEESAKDKQIIACTNNEFLLNGTDIRNWNILHRSGSSVKAYNYSNNKNQLERFASSGLSNYEYFRDEYYLGGPK